MKKLIVLAASFVLVASFAMTAAAADWNFYGSSRVSTFWESTEINGGSGDQDVDNYAQGLQSNARIGAKVKVSDELSGRFEYGASGGNANIRLLYGEWNFGSGSLLIGQTYAPLNVFGSNQVYGGDTDLLPYGGIYSGREAMIMLKFGGFQVAIMEPDENDDIGGRNNEKMIPAIELGYKFSGDTWNVELIGGYSTYETTIGLGNDIDVDSFVGAIAGGVNFGSFFVNGNIWMGQNVNNLIALDTTGGGWGSGGSAGLFEGEIDDNDSVGFLIAVGAKLNDMFTVELGYGAAEQERDSWDDSDDVSSVYLNSTITWAPGVFVVPEIGLIDFDEDGQKEITYFGAKWQINF